MIAGCDDASGKLDETMSDSNTAGRTSSNSYAKLMTCCDPIGPLARAQPSVHEAPGAFRDGLMVSAGSVFHYRRPAVASVYRELP
jgi:hypothetical protein